jgi:hypothetical protein
MFSRLFFTLGPGFSLSGNKNWIDFYLGLFFTSFDFKQPKDNHFLKEYFVDFSCT